MLYYGIGKYISQNSRKGFWGKGAIDAISDRLDKELPVLKGFSARNLRNMRTFYEEWNALDHMRDEELILADASAKTVSSSALQIWQTLLPNSQGILTRIFTGMREKGLLREDDPEMLAFAYTAPISALVHLCDREPEKTEEAIRQAEAFSRHFIKTYSTEEELDR